jgi:poly-gamma-glutamate synthesis protein (capsule biosynthesis protein)
MGDVMLGRLMNEVLRDRGPAHPWGDMLPLLRSADVRLINLECVIAGGGEAWTRTRKVFHFRADPSALSSLRVAAIDCVSLANNHVLDYGEVALEEMLQHLDSAGIAHAGAGHNRDEAFQPAILAVRGVRIAVVACTDNQPEWAATPSAAGVSFVRIAKAGPGTDTLLAAIASARAGADFVVCSIHWGPNMRQRPPPGFRTFAQWLLDSGVDLVYGHSAHVVQGIEVYRGKPILYDTGDFVDDYAVDPTLRNDRSFLFRLTIGEGRVIALDLMPVLISGCQVHQATDRDFRDTCTTMCRLSEELGTTLEECATGLQLTL